jgi:N-acetylneuraminate synthase/sialic acid synthase
VVNRRVVIDGVTVDDASDCYVIAEIGHNHQGDVERCKDLFRAARDCGASAVKLQKRDNRTLFTREMFERPYLNRNSYGRTYGEHRQALEFDRDEYLELRKYAEELDITLFATAFDHASADFLARLEAPAFKIASGDLTNVPLLRHVAALRRPLILSTGGGTMEDVQRAYDAIMPVNPQLCILQCTAGYPPPFEELNLRVIETFRDRFPEATIGLSSHDSGIAMGLVGYVLGARVIEKHFTLNRASKGTDHAFSLEPPGLRRLVRDLRRARLALGDGVKRRYESEEQPLLKMSKQLVMARDVPAGHLLAREDLAIRSPGGGLPPYEIERVVGRVTLRDLRADEGVEFKDLARGR